MLETSQCLPHLTAVPSLFKYLAEKQLKRAVYKHAGLLRRAARMPGSFSGPPKGPAGTVQRGSGWSAVSPRGAHSVAALFLFRRKRGSFPGVLARRQPPAPTGRTSPALLSLLQSLPCSRLAAGKAGLNDSDQPLLRHRGRKRSLR